MNSKATMNSKAILDLMNDEANDEMVKDAIAYTMDFIQRHMIVAHLPKGLLEIMNMWARTGRWYDDDGDSKFEKCLWKVVSSELKKRVFDLLFEWMNEDDGLICPENDLFYALSTASNSLYYHKEEYWPTMGAELETEARQWIQEHDELSLIESSDGGYFQYYDCGNEEVSHHLPHLPKPNRFSKEEEKEAGWVCVGVNTLVPC
jgi:hypothetical protein